MDVVEVINSVTSTRTDAALAAAQGKVLKGLIDTANNTIKNLQNSLNSINNFTFGMNTNPSSLSDFCNKIFAYNRHFVWFKCQFPASMHPDKQASWIHGYCTIQNTNYTYQEVMTIFATTSTGNYTCDITALNNAPKQGTWYQIGKAVFDKITSVQNALQTNINTVNGRVTTVQTTLQSSINAANNNLKNAIYDTNYVSSYTISVATGEFVYIFDSNAIYRIIHYSYANEVQLIAGSKTLNWTVSGNNVKFTAAQSGSNVRLIVVRPYGS